MTDNPHKDKDPQDSAPVDDSEAAATSAEQSGEDAAGDTAQVTAADADANAEDKADAAAADSLTPVEKLQQDVQELTEDLQRVTAEFANYRKRVQRDLEIATESGKAHVVSQLIHIADDIDRAASHGDLQDGSPLKAFSDKFMNTLSGLNVAAFGDSGELFDANIHEAIQDEGGDGDKVLSTVIRKGYKLGDRILRTAMVMVRGDDGAAADADGADDAADSPADE